MRTLTCTILALIAFAANSILCRMALGVASIDPASFSTVRVASGALTLLVIWVISQSKGAKKLSGSWVSAGMLFLYMISFSFAYVSLSAGTGALILFGAVQATMILSALWEGERPRREEWLGLVMAIAGLVYLVSPGLTAPSLTGSTLMAIAGIAWGVYTLRGRGSADSLGETTGNFVRAVPFVIVVSLLALRDMNLSAEGALLAVLSGAFASGLGYAVWYAALRGLTSIRAATVQLTVPVLAAGGGVLFLDESISYRLAISAILILTGIGLAVTGKFRKSRVTV